MPNTLSGPSSARKTLICVGSLCVGFPKPSTMEFLRHCMFHSVQCFQVVVLECFNKFLLLFIVDVNNCVCYLYHKNRGHKSRKQHPKPGPGNPGNPTCVLEACFLNSF